MDTSSPYSLTAANGRSDDYYLLIAALAARWLSAARITLARPINDHLAWRKTRPLAVSFEEAAFEMLVLGVLLREHGAEALNLPPLPAWLLARLIDAQDRLPIAAVEKPVKAARGLIQGLAKAGETPEDAVDEQPFPGGAGALAGRMVDWLEAAGLSAQANHVSAWRDYLLQLPEQAAQAVLARCLLLADEFAVESEPVLGVYTTGVDRLIEALEHGPDNPWAHGCRARWRYDAALVTRGEVEYHLAMLGTEILSRAYRARYEAQPRKIVIVPDCLCARSRRVESSANLECQAQLTSLGYRCAGCTPGCRVNQLTKLGEKRGFEAYILPDDLRGVGLGACSKLNGVGVVGVSCALTNFDAGWLVNDAGVPAQGLLLDYAGCRSHWDDAGQTTDFNLKRLLEIV